MPPVRIGDRESTKASPVVWERWGRRLFDETPRDLVASVAAVGFGGVLGAIARYLVGLWAAALWGSGGFPAGTFLVNVIGSFVLGFYLTLTTERFAGRRSTRLVVATGFLGSFTTFSTFSFELAGMLQGGDLAGAGLYAAASLGFGLVAVVAGLLCARAL